jgi:PAS domain S-box-containing protein
VSSEADSILLNERLFSDTMVESMPGILYFYDASGRFLRWNRNFEVVSGYGHDEIAGMHPHDFFATEDRARVQARIQQVFRSGESSMEAPFLSKNGTRTPYFFTGRRVEFEGRPCLVGVGMDISDRVRTEQRLADSERRYRELVEHANSIILRWDSQGRIAFLNEFGQRFFGYTAQEIVGRHVIGTLVPPTDAAGSDLGQLMEQICAAPAAFEQNTNENMRRNGERVWISWTNRIELDANGAVAAILSIGTDITERRRAEAERERRLRAEEADRIKSAFLATMSHELRTPLNSIIGFTGVMLQGLAGPLNDEQRKQLDMVRSSARHLLALVNDVLDISKIEAGQLSVAHMPFDARRSIDKVLALVSPQATAKQLALRVQAGEGLGQLVGDQRRFEQVLLNLLSNAIKFTDYGEVTLVAERRTDDTLQVQVCDTGIGIGPDDLQSLFQPFKQVESGLARRHEGTGLGLAICRRLTELMGGRIDAASEWGKGSIFTVTLPIQAIARQ